MKYLIAIFCGITTFVSCGQKNSEIKSLDPIAFKNAINENAIILDVRTPQEVSSGMIGGASTLDFYSENFENSLALIQKDKEVFVYCLSGGRSSKAAKKLVELGQHKVYNLKGGIRAWKKENLPITENQNTSIENQAVVISQDSLNAIINEYNTVLVAFQTKWCAPCRKMEPIIDSLELNNARVHFLKIDMDKNDALAKNMNVESIPTILIFKNQKEIWRSSGIQTMEKLSSLLQ